MPDIDTSVDELTDLILRTLDDHRYRPNRATLHARFLLHGWDIFTDGIQFRRQVVLPVLELWARADTYVEDPVWAVNQWEDDVPNDTILTWAQHRSDELRWDARQLIRDYLTGLLGGDQ